MTGPGPAIAPSILSADFGRLCGEIRRVERAGADWLHVDVMDGHFVPNLTIGPVVVAAVKKCTRLRLDTHLMIDHPEKYVPAFAQAGAWNITIHVEACRRPADVLRLIRKHGCRAGLSLRPGTPVERLRPYLRSLDLVLVMTVEPGFGGQSFMSDMLSKVRWLKTHWKRARAGRPIIEVDGGINRDTAPLAAHAGATALVAGHAIFGAADPGRALRHIRHAAQVPVL